MYLSNYMYIRILMYLQFVGTCLFLKIRYYIGGVRIEFELNTYES